MSLAYATISRTDQTPPFLVSVQVSIFRWRSWTDGQGGQGPTGRVGQVQASASKDTAASISANRMLRRREVELLTGLSRSPLYAWTRDGTFPKPVKVGKRAVGCPEDVIQDWLISRRDAA